MPQKGCKMFAKSSVLQQQHKRTIMARIKLLVFGLVLAAPMPTKCWLAERAIRASTATGNGTGDTSQQDFLYSFVAQVHGEQPIAALLLLQHRQDNSCVLQHWSSSDWPVLRNNERSQIQVRNFSREVLALVCIRELSDMVLISTLATNLEGMREARVIILLQVEAVQEPEDFLTLLQQLANRHHFYNVLMLQGKREFTLNRMYPFPEPRFQQMQLLYNTERIFIQHWRNFQNKTALMIPTLVPPNSFMSRNPRTGKEYYNGFCYNLMQNFAKHYNISLKLLNPFNRSSVLHTPEIMTLVNSGQLDIVSNLQPFSRRLHWPGTQNSAHLGIVSLLMVVPCGGHLSIQEVYKNIIPLNWLLYIFCVYLTFAVLETLATRVSYIILAKTFNFRYSQLWLNLRVLRGFLGQAAPVQRCMSFSLRQFLLVLSFLGLLFCSCFSAQLSTLLTKHPHYKHIQSYEELNASRLPVVYDWNIRLLIEDDYDAEYFEKRVPNAVFMSSKDQAELILSLNASYAYLAFSYLWNAINMYQKAHKRRILCMTKTMHVAEALPMNTVLQMNSIYAIALDHFIINAQSSGVESWLKTQAYRDVLIAKLPNIVNTTTTSDLGPKYAPLLFWDLKCLWEFLLTGYAVAIVVFIIEKSLSFWKRN